LRGLSMRETMAIEALCSMRKEAARKSSAVTLSCVKLPVSAKIPASAIVASSGPRAGRGASVRSRNTWCRPEGIAPDLGARYVRRIRPDGGLDRETSGTAFNKRREFPLSFLSSACRRP
jgi:hypothetical protein